MRAYVLNLPSAAERRNHMASELAKTGIEYELISAVEGSKIDLADPALVAGTWVEEPPYAKANVAGCALSHLRAYQRVLTQGLGVALVLEDDVLLPKELGQLVASASALMRGAEVVLLHFGTDSPCRLVMQGAEQLTTAHLLAHPVPKTKVGCSAAYLVTSEACRRLADAILPVRVRPDHWTHFLNSGVLDSVRCVWPMPVGLNHNFRSTIGNYEAGSWQQRLSDLVDATPLLRCAASVRRQRIDKKKTRAEIVTVDRL